MSIEPLGIVVNGLSAERDKGYYAYAEGYNYGYGADSYGAHGDADEELHTEGRAVNALPPPAVTPSARVQDAPSIVPRRAA
jgi:hypothetical protein